MKIWLKIFALATFTGCAIESMPTGGPKDSAPPEIVSVSPENYTLNFEDNEIKIKFNEYVKLNNFPQQFSVSPSLKNDIEHRIKKKTLIIKINDTLLENTTYTFNFGNSIQDFTEGNSLTGFSYVISTGNYLDSGFVHGTVKDAFTMRAIEEITVLLHPADAPDSAIFNQRPLYYTTTKADGSFQIKNIPERPFQVFALEDKDFNFNYSPGVEAIGFIDTLAMPDSTRKKLEIRSFNEETPFTFMRASAKKYGHGEVYFKGDARNRIQLIPQNSTDESFFTDYNKKGDTLDLWFYPSKFIGNPFLLTYQIGDSTIKDTLNFLFREKEPGKFTGRFITRDKFGPNDTMQFEFNHPVKEINKNLLILTLGEDTLSEGFDLFVEMDKIKIYVPSQEGRKGTILMLPNAVEDMFGIQNQDTLKANFAFGVEADFSNLKVALSPDTIMPVIFEILNEKMEVIYTKTTSKNEKFNLRYLQPGKYKFRLIWDENQNGQWDTGNVLQNKQPEWVTYYQENIELRANWLLEIEWKVHFPGGENLEKQ